MLRTGLSYLVYPLDRAMSMVGYAGVMAYRRFVSPYKGFRCAHAAYAGGPSCSTVALRSFRHQTFSSACRSIHGQFGQCRASYFRMQDWLAMIGDGLTSFGHPGNADVIIKCCGD